ncbi:MAG: hypothetical protein M3Z24_04020, partial [Chloroflexota bacterium]|nr:hypothetical protein [Chloroflexota bacterium]
MSWRAKTALPAPIIVMFGVVMAHFLVIMYGTIRQNLRAVLTVRSIRLLCYLNTKTRIITANCLSPST